jgi:hypothetical protein
LFNEAKVASGDVVLQPLISLFTKMRNELEWEEETSEEGTAPKPAKRRKTKC